MSRGTLALGVALAVLAASPVLARDGDLLGRWRTPAKDGIVVIERCGAALCGRLHDAAPLRADPNQRDVRNRDAALRSRPLKNLTVLDGFSGGPRTWSGGPLYDPNTGQAADRGALTLVDDDTLAVKGCIAPLLCRTQTWKRVR